MLKRLEVDAHRKEQAKLEQEKDVLPLIDEGAIKLYDKQLEFLEAAEDEVLALGGRGSGKSEALVMDPLRDCGNPNFRGLLIRRKMPDLRTLIQRAKKLYPKVYPGTKWRDQEKLFVFPSGAVIEFGYLDHLDDLDRYQGQEYTWIGIDEITQFPEKDWIDRLKMSLRTTDKKLKTSFRATTNPNGGGRAWVKEYFYDLGPSSVTLPIYSRKNKDQVVSTRKYIHSTVADCLAIMENDPKYVEMLESIDNEVLRKQWLLGDMEAFEGSAFSEFKSTTHVIKPFEIPYDWYRFRACDWGYQNMAVCLWFAVDYDDNLYIYREYATRLETADVFAKNILALEKGEHIAYGVLDTNAWADSGQVGETEAETMQNLGLYWNKAVKGPNSRKQTKQLVHRYLNTNPITGRPGVVVFDTCRELIKELGDLQCDPNNPEEIIRGRDHAYDALRYGLATRPVLSASMTYRSPFTDTTPYIVDPIFGY